MAHYAFLNENNIVTEVIVGIDEGQLVDGKDAETWYGEFRNQRCVRTSYTGSIRMRFAGIGYSYDSENDVFVEPQPYSSWTYNLESFSWDPPTPKPGPENRRYMWNEATLSWIDPAPVQE